MVTLTFSLWAVVVLAGLVVILFFGYALLPPAAQEAVRQLVAELARLMSGRP
jgi:hypothetical protein